jgi:hypothetical protein
LGWLAFWLAYGSLRGEVGFHASGWWEQAGGVLPEQEAARKESGKPCREAEKQQQGFAKFSHLIFSITHN